jgi:polyhydroxyalkanoate synthesis regulator phasin
MVRSKSANDKLKQLHKTIDTIAKAREIQNIVDSNVMRKEMTQEELERFHRPMIDLIQEKSDQLESTTRIPIEGPSLSLIQSIEEP